MQQTQQSYKLMTYAVHVALLALMVAVGRPAFAGSPTRNDILLDGAAKGPCEPGLGQPDYVAGVDVNGNPVAPADLPVARRPVPDEILVPLGNKQGHSGEGPIIAMSGRALDPILNPRPACPSQGR